MGKTFLMGISGLVFIALFVIFAVAFGGSNFALAAGGYGANFDLEYVTAEPANPDASFEARAVLNFHYSIYGKKMMTGQMESGSWDGGPDSELDYIKEYTGVLPAIRGLDFIHEDDNSNVVQRAIEWWQKGGIPTIMWHWGAPTFGEGYENSQRRIDVRAALTPGTEENEAMMADLDRIAAYLKELDEADVPIVWRPLHEVDGGWFWWSKDGPEPAIELWQFMFKYFTDEWQLNNLIWAYCYTQYPREEWYPGDEYVDLVGSDVYDKGYIPPDFMFFRAKDIVGPEMPIIYHECGPMPDPKANFEAGMTWAWFMNWHTDWLYDQPVEHLRYVYDHKVTLTLKDLPDLLEPELGPAPEIAADFESLKKDKVDESDKISYNLEDKFTVGDEGADLKYEAVSSNQQLIKTEIEIIDGAHFLNLYYTAGESGETEISVVAENEAGRSKEQKFTVNVIDPASDDLARGRPVAASSVSDRLARKPENINDGSTGTHWQSEQEDEQWIYIDLEEERLIERVALNWAENYPQIFEVQIGADYKQWETVYSEEEGSEGVQFINLDPPVEGRYLRLQLLESATGKGFSLRLMTVFGDALGK